MLHNVWNIHLLAHLRPHLDGEIVRLSLTPNNCDGELFRVRHCGHVADVRAIAELERYFPLAELNTDDTTLAARHRLVPDGLVRATWLIRITPFSVKDLRVRPS